MRIAVTYRVIQHWRVPVFSKLLERSGSDLAVIHSQGVDGTKLVNGKNCDCLPCVALFTIGGRLKLSGREVPLLLCPGLLCRLIILRPKVILAEGGSNVLNNFSVFLFSAMFRVPVVWWTLGMIPGRRYTGLGRIYRYVVDRMETRSAALLGYSQVAMDYFQEKGYPRDKCFKAVNCVDTDAIFSVVESDRAGASLLREKFGLSGDDFIVLFCGALNAAKRIDRLLLAFARVLEGCKFAKLFIVGGGADSERLVSMSRAIGISESCYFVGEIIDGVGSYFEMADLFVLPGLGGLAVSEAMAHGLPVICGRGDGCEVDLVRNGVNGFRYDPDELGEDGIVSAIAESVAMLASDRDLRKSMSEESLKIIREEHNIGSYVDSISEAIEYAVTGYRDETFS